MAPSVPAFISESSAILLKKVQGETTIFLISAGVKIPGAVQIEIRVDDIKISSHKTSYQIVLCSAGSLRKKCIKCCLFKSRVCIYQMMSTSSLSVNDQHFAVCVKRQLSNCVKRRLRTPTPGEVYRQSTWRGLTVSISLSTLIVNRRSSILGLGRPQNYCSPNISVTSTGWATSKF